MTYWRRAFDVENRIPYQTQQVEPVIPAELALPESSGRESCEDGERGKGREYPRYHNNDPRFGIVDGDIVSLDEPHGKCQRLKVQQE